METLAPHHMNIRNDDPNKEILFVTEIKDHDADIQSISEKRRYYNGTSRQSRSAKAEIRGGGNSEDQKG